MTVRSVTSIFGIAKRGFGMLGKAKKASSTISSVKPGKNLAKKRKNQDEVIKAKDRIMKDLPTEGKVKVRTSVPLKNTNKEIANILDRK